LHLALRARCSINAIVDKMFFSNSEQTSTGCTLITLFMSIPISVLFELSTNNSDGSNNDSIAIYDIKQIHTLIANQQTVVIAALVITGALASLLGFCYTQCYRAASATTVAVAGNVNKLLSIVVGFLLFDDKLSFVKFIGIFVCLVGGFLYSIFEKGNKKKTAEVMEELDIYNKDKKGKRRGFCSVCEVELSLNKDNTIRKHKEGPRARKNCAGAGKPPKED